MQLLAIAIAVAVLIGVVMMLPRLRQRQGPASVDFPYGARALFTPAERSFLGVLEQALAGRYRVFGKVRLADLLSVRGGLSSPERGAAFNRIKAKHADIVLCAPDDLRPVAVLELDDASHASAPRQRRDEFFDRAFEAAGIPVHRFTTKASYSVHDVRSALALQLDSGLAEPQVPSTHPPTFATEVHAQLDPAPAGATAGTCPRCGSTLVTRVAKRGERRGQEFVACSAFPSCRYVAGVSDGSA